ncbi:DUF1194 domain-containing protein [Maritimibacter sp. DP1N21-5]|uniref:DUF1194 domain-containing protein n=1 Tax=Maritimibacter sp. DP1N21-5 TaxID=2836867 RepID=UPI00351D4994
MPNRRHRRPRTFALATALAAFPASTQACSLALVLALDVSASIDPAEYDLQQEGLARALTDPDVVAAIEGTGGIWLSVYEWSGARHQYEQIPWTWVDTAATVAKAASTLRDMRRRADDFPTSLGYALGYGLITLTRAPEICARAVIDISSDGDNNDGFPPESAYDAHDLTGVTVNALVIEDENPDLAGYYRENVIRGDAAFVEIARDYQDYGEAMRRKLLREIGALAFAAADH